MIFKDFLSPPITKLRINDLIINILQKLEFLRIYMVVRFKQSGRHLGEREESYETKLRTGIGKKHKLAIVV